MVLLGGGRNDAFEEGWEKKWLREVLIYSHPLPGTFRPQRDASVHFCEEPPDWLM